MLCLQAMEIIGIGRVDVSSFTDQQMMESFFIPDTFEEARLALGGDEDDACTWDQVWCEESKYIAQIEWHSVDIKLEGSINFKMMPRHLTYLNLFEQKLIGEVDTTNLPEKLNFFCIEKCLFTGTVDLGHLPQSLETFVARDNKISGLVNVCNLPSGLQNLQIRENTELKGTISIAKLPRSLHRLKLELGDSVSVRFLDRRDEAIWSH